MCEWARRMHRHASLLGDVMLCGHYINSHWSIEKVKFGVPLESFCSDELPGPLLVLLLKLNKEGCDKRDVFRAPGHEAAMRRLEYSLHVGRLINIEHYSVNTVASVIKKFLRKIPGGVFTPKGEMELFATVNRGDLQQLQETTRKVIKSLPICTQKLLCVLLGTFKAIANSTEVGKTGMTAEAIGVSVAPSFFHSCVADNKLAILSDVHRFKEASNIMRFIIDRFFDGSLFEMPIYEYYSRVSGRIFIINNILVCSPLPADIPPDHRLYAIKEEDEDVDSPEDMKQVSNCPDPRVLDGTGDDSSSQRRALILQEMTPSTPPPVSRMRYVWQRLAYFIGTLSCGLCCDFGMKDNCCLRDDDPDMYEMVTATPSPSDHVQSHQTPVPDSNNSTTATLSPSDHVESHQTPVPDSSNSTSPSASPAQTFGPLELEEWSPTQPSDAILDSPDEEDARNAPGSRVQSPDRLIPDHSGLKRSFSSTPLSQLALQVGKTWYQCQCNRWSVKKSEGLTEKESHASMPALCQPGPSSNGDALDSIPEHCLLDSKLRLSSSLEDSVFMDPEPSTSRANASAHVTLEDLRPLVVHNETAKSLNCLPQVSTDVGCESTGIACGCAAEVPIAGLQHELTIRSRSLSSLVK